MNNTLKAAAFAWLIVGFASSSHGQDPFRTNIRPTKWLSPQEEQKTFSLPEGFEIQLFAAEPDIQKPLNMAFDARGRLWLTDSREYPYPVPEGKAGRDTIKILEDTTGDGRADKITTFADGLNIPIGIYPYRDGAIVWSIPNIWFLRDTNGDGTADKREKLYGPFGWQRDTHGMNNGFTRGADGWLYACHGFNNQTTVSGTDGHEITMQSGNTYRFRLDGSRIEHFTHGQVNPFGMTMTGFGDLLTADCHSKPLYLLVREGYYPSFGKPHDGLGFVPSIMTHTHGSTALCGPSYYAGENFPAEYRGNVFVGNVMTSRVNRNQLKWHGSTPVAVEQPDLVATSDPWFRPVDIQTGPDGAVYVADFYNKIIGHYEVPLDHPERDRTSGRIWRIVYTGDAEESRPAKRPVDLTTASDEELVVALASPNLTYRMLALNYIADEKTGELREKLVGTLVGGTPPPAETGAAIASILERTGSIDKAVFDTAVVNNDDPKMVSQLVRILGQRKAVAAENLAWLLDLLRDDRYRGVVRRQVAAAVARHPRKEHVEALLAAIDDCPPDDTLLRHQLRIALRNHLQVPGALEQLQITELDPELAHVTADMAMGINTPASGNYLVQYLMRFPVENPQQAAEYVRQAARFADDTALERLVPKLRESLEDRPHTQLIMLHGIGQGLQQCGCKPGAAAQAWANTAVKRALAGDHTALLWTTKEVAGKPHRPDMFVTQVRASADGNNNHPFFCSLVHGEQLCGVHRSSAFELPDELSFFMAGHNGYPNVSQRTGNLVRLVDASTGEVLREAPPPRNDVAQKIVWELNDLAGKFAVVEIIDADSASAYAWLAVGRFSLAKLNPSSLPERLRLASDLIGQWAVPGCEGLLEKQLAVGHDPLTEATLANALLGSAAADARLRAAATLLDQPVAPSVRQAIVAAVIARDEKSIVGSVELALSRSPAAVQQRLAEELASTPVGSATLVELIAAGKGSPRLLGRPVVVQRLEATGNQDLLAKAAGLTANLPPASDQITQRIAAVRESYTKTASSLANGAAVFKKNCSICHKIGNEGELIGPQLDGIGNRGLDRVLEDLLDPHRNVDVQFRTSSLAMTDGRVLSGLVRELPGDLLELIDSQGKKATINPEQIEQRRTSPLSLMPDNMVDKLSPAELHDLIGFLLSQAGGGDGNRE